MDKKADDMSSTLMTFMMTEIAKNTVLNEGVQKILNDPNEQFDAVIVEWMYSDVTAG